MGVNKEQLSACYHEDYKKNWIQTYTGRQFFPFDPYASEVEIEDIAHALSNTCRFTGHVQTFYSVAQHSVLVSQLVPPEHALCGLLHDASEAYLCDIPSPIKPGIPQYQELEKLIQERIAKEFNLPHPYPPCIKHADQVAVATEARDLMPNTTTMWRLPVTPLMGLTVSPWSPVEAERHFLELYRELTR